jgi:tryptophan-rich sensory protein
MIDWIRLVISLAVPLMIGGVGGQITSKSLDDWYPALRKPSWNPPNWVFPIAWTTLFVAMGVALYRVWGLGLDTPGVVLALTFFGIQLVLNVLWSFFFFGLRSPPLALVEVFGLWAAVAATLWTMGSLDAISGWLLAPYLAWVTFAAVLTAEIVRLNRG